MLIDILCLTAHFFHTHTHIARMDVRANRLQSYKLFLT